MNATPHNFRLFFGTKTLSAWQAFSCREIYANDVAYYEELKGKLEQEIATETHLRDELRQYYSQLNKSKEFTLSESNPDSQKLQKHIDRLNNQLDQFMNQLQDQLNHMVKQGSHLESFENQQKARLDSLSHLGGSMHDLQDELDEIHLEQSSVQDPIMDLKFAIDYLEKKARQSQQDADFHKIQFKSFLIETCSHCSARQLAHLKKQGLYMLVPEITGQLIFKIQDLSFDLKVTSSVMKDKLISERESSTELVHKNNEVIFYDSLQSSDEQKLDHYIDLLIQQLFNPNSLKDSL